jgi:hypothetical protein
VNYAFLMSNHPPSIEASFTRHDIDREIPRTPKEIYELNRMMTGKMREAFGEDVVIVPSIGKHPVRPRRSVSKHYSRIFQETTTFGVSTS